MFCLSVCWLAVGFFSSCVLFNRVSHKLDEIVNNANIGIRGFATWKLKLSSNKMLLSMESLGLWFQIQHSAF